MSLRRRLASSARARILLSTILLLAFATLGSALVLRAVLTRQVAQRLDAALVQEVDEFRRLAESGVDPRTGEPLGDNIRALFDVFLARNVAGKGESFVTFLDGNPYLVSADRASREAQAQDLREFGAVSTVTRARLTTRIGEVQLIAVPVTGAGGARGTLVVTADIGADAAEIDQAARAAGIVSLAMLLVGSALAFLLAGRVLAPLRHLSDAATQISESDLSRRIEVSGHDEIAEVGRTFNAMLDRIEAGFRTQRDFVSDAGHELRTPITIIRGHLELLPDEPSERRETIALVVDELDRMSRFVDDLLLLARAEHGAAFLQEGELDIDDLTDELLRKARGLGDRAWTLDAVGLGRMRGDRQRLTQAVMNLARNAVEHTAPGDVIAIGSAADQGEVRFWVRDSGPGVAVAEQDRIFERFTRGRGGRRRSEGAGLGLAIVQAIATAHGGRVELASRPGEGATFSIVVPGEPADPGALDDDDLTLEHPTVVGGSAP